MEECIIAISDKYSKLVDNCMSEITTRFPEILKYPEKTVHVMKQHDSGYHMIKFKGIPVAEFIIKESRAETTYNFDATIKYLVDKIQEIENNL